MSSSANWNPFWRRSRTRADNGFVGYDRLENSSMTDSRGSSSIMSLNRKS